MIPLNRAKVLKFLGIRKVWVGVMGCICSKGGQQSNGSYNVGSSDGKATSKGKSKKSSRRLVLKREQQDVETDEEYENVCSIINQGNDDMHDVGSSSPLATAHDHHDDKKSKSKMSGVGIRSMAVANGEKGAQVVAGWPSWLTSVAGEAINGWIPRRLDSFEKLEKIGQGTYSSVYKARDLESKKIVALKKVRFANMDPESVKFMAREIIILRRLDHQNVMKLEGIITSRMSGSLYLVFEYMDHDLSGLLSSAGSQFTESQIKCYMKQLLQGLEHCHSRGIMHRDMKGSNLLIDSNGILKIADFGLATFCKSNDDQPLTSRVVTLWYRPPELLLGSTEYGVEVDLWSSGCILAELFNGKPIMPGRTEVEQIHKIFKLCGSPSDEYWKKSKLSHNTVFKPQQPYKRRFAETFKDLIPSSAMALLEVLLAVEPENRGSASSALTSEFFTTEPFPCDPSTLPTYPPSKEFDVKFREDEAKRKSRAGGKGRGRESERITFTKGTRLVAASNAKRRSKAHETKDRSIINNERQSNKDEDESSNKASTSTNATSTSCNDGRNSKQTPPSKAAAQAAQLSRFSNSVVIRDNNSDYDYGGGHSDHWQKVRFNYHGLEDSKGDVHRPTGMDSTRAFFGKKGRMHHSGPLMTAGGNIEEMLKEHERRIQHAVRKARSGKNKNFQADGEGEQDGSQLYREKK
ncbi:Probable serine/threonine-protein kinase At1g09600 [Linum grandiflorum]